MPAPVPPSVPFAQYADWIMPAARRAPVIGAPPAPARTREDARPVVRDGLRASLIGLASEKSGVMARAPDSVRA